MSEILTQADDTEIIRRHIPQSHELEAERALRAQRYEEYRINNEREKLKQEQSDAEDLSKKLFGDGTLHKQW